MSQLLTLFGDTCPNLEQRTAFRNLMHDLMGDALRLFTHKREDWEIKFKQMLVAKQAKLCEFPKEYETVSHEDYIISCLKDMPLSECAEDSQNVAGSGFIPDPRLLAADEKEIGLKTFFAIGAGCKNIEDEDLKKHLIKLANNLDYPVSKETSDKVKACWMPPKRISDKNCIGWNIVCGMQIWKTRLPRYVYTFEKDDEKLKKEIKHTILFRLSEPFHSRVRSEDTYFENMWLEWTANRLLEYYKNLLKKERKQQHDAKVKCENEIRAKVQAEARDAQIAADAMAKETRKRKKAQQVRNKKNAAAASNTEETVASDASSAAASDTEETVASDAAAVLVGLRNGDGGSNQ